MRRRCRVSIRKCSEGRGSREVTLLWNVEQRRAGGVRDKGVCLWVCVRAYVLSPMLNVVSYTEIIVEKMHRSESSDNNDADESDARFVLVGDFVKAEKKASLSPKQRATAAVVSSSSCNPCSARR